MNSPFLLRPAAKDYLWGGNRLNTDFAKGIDIYPLAETWECSTHSDGQSVVASGSFCGQTLDSVLREQPEFLGTHLREYAAASSTKNGLLPILIKFIDAKQDLSVQVHPDDDFAARYEGGERGKTEMWYVVDAAPGTQLVCGLRHSTSPDELRRSIEGGVVEKHLQRVPVKSNDLFFITAGTVHAIGAGALIAEIQQNSNITYRLYDYDRVDKDGNRRQLHIDKALACANLEATEEPKQPLRVLSYSRGCARELLCRCKYFEVHRMLVNTAQGGVSVEYVADSLSYRVLLCTEGGARVAFADQALECKKGDCIFVPANSYTLYIDGSAQFLDVRG